MSSFLPPFNHCYGMHGRAVCHVIEGGGNKKGRPCADPMKSLEEWSCCFLKRHRSFHASPQGEESWKAGCRCAYSHESLSAVPWRTQSLAATPCSMPLQILVCAGSGVLSWNNTEIPLNGSFSQSFPPCLRVFCLEEEMTSEKEDATPCHALGVNAPSCLPLPFSQSASWEAACSLLEGVWF